MTTTPRKITKQQLRILQFIVRFRHVNSKQLKTFLGIQQIDKQLRVMQRDEYIGCHHTAYDKRNNLYATYYLLPKGIKMLKHYDLDNGEYNKLRKDSSASLRFVNHNLAIATIYADLKQKYRSQLQFFTKSEFQDFDYFPVPLPDAYFTLNKPHDRKTAAYFLEVWDSLTPFYIYKRRLSTYIEFAEQGNWEITTDTNLPTVFVVCDTKTLEQKVQELLTKVLDTHNSKLSFTYDVIGQSPLSKYSQ